MSKKYDNQGGPSLFLLKEEILKGLSQELQFPLHVVRAVIDNQFRTASKAVHEVSSIEIAGFGKFILKENRVRARIKSYTNTLENLTKIAEDPTQMEELSIGKAEVIEFKINSIKESLIYLNMKLDGFTKTK